ncbi:MAG: hypothetical protein PVJ60_08850 [Phycisphaerales bacterium]
MKLRIAAAAAVGVVLIGILGWPLASVPDPLSTILAGYMSTGNAVILLFLAFLSGVIAYFLSWPYGREIGILAAPSGLVIWAVRSGNMANLIQINPTAAQRQALFASLKWDSLFWLAVVAVGFTGVLLCQKVLSKSSAKTNEKSKPNGNSYLNAVIALVGSGLIAQICIRILAQDVSALDSKLGSVVAQPHIGQIAFAVFTSFGIAAFIVNKFLDAGYIWPISSCFLITAFTTVTYAKHEILQHLAEQWPTTFFLNSVIAISPLQMVAFGTIGSIAGYWMAFRYDYWRKHESK